MRNGEHISGSCAYVGGDRLVTGIDDAEQILRALDTQMLGNLYMILLY